MDNDPSALDDLRERVQEKWQEEYQRRTTSRYKKPTVGFKSALMSLCRVELLSWLRADAADKRSSSSDGAILPRQTGPAADDLAEAAGAERRTRAATADEPVATVHPSEPIDGDDPVTVTPGGGGVQHPGKDDEGSAGSDEHGEARQIRPGVVHQVDNLGRKLHKGVLTDVEREVGGALDDNARRAMADHFWCEVFAQLARALHSGLKILDRVPEWVADSVIDARRNAQRLPVDSVIVKSAVKNLWKHVQHMTRGGILVKGKTMVLVFRVLAVLICKSPDHHRAVVEYCVNPLDGVLLASTKRRLRETFQDWLIPVREPQPAGAVLGTKGASAG